MCYYNEPPPECFNCEEKDDKMKEIKYWFQAVLSQLYGEEDFSLSSLEYYLDEVAHSLGMRLPSQALRVEGKTNVVSMDTLLKQWQTSVNEYANKLLKTGS